MQDNSLLKKMPYPFIILIVLFSFTSILRVIELIISNKNFKSRKDENGITIPIEKSFFLFVLLHVSFLILVPVEVFYLNRPFHNSLGITMLLIYFICLILRFHVLNVLGKNWNTKVIYNPISEDSITTTGIYKYIRHPNYLIVILEILSLSLFHTAIWSFLFFSLCNLVLLFFRINFEEEKLFKNVKYLKHFADKKRFIPGIF